MTPNRAFSVTHRGLIIAASIVIVGLLAVFGLAQCDSSGSSAANTATGASATPSSGLPTVAVASLPARARSVLVLIDKGGPYPYAQDNTVFGNNEGLLPKRARGYYHEYTVATPGSGDRGERRLVVGRDGDIYYTSDHYNSFRQVIR